jgi:DNA-binding ferritin-like protein
MSENCAYHLAFDEAIKEMKENQKEIFERLRVLENDKGTTIYQLNTLTKLLTDTGKKLDSSIEILTAKIEKLSLEPGKRWNNLITTLITSGIIGAVGFIIGKLIK